MATKKNTDGIKASDFLRDYLPNINEFTKRIPKGGYTWDGMKAQWLEGKIPSGTLRHIASKLKYKVQGNTNNYDLLASMLRDREEILKKLSEEPALDVIIEIRQKGLAGATPSLRSGLLE